MKLVTYEAAGASRLGALVAENQILDLAVAGQKLGRPCPADMLQLIEAGDRAWDNARTLIEEAPDEALRTGNRLLAPLARPVRFRDCNLFLEHMEVALEKIARLARERGEQPATEGLPAVYKQQCIYYNADHLHIYGPGEDIPWPPHS
jgi:hypothetical protein